MATRGGGRLGDGRGGDSLAELLKAMKPVAPARPTPTLAQDSAAASRRRPRATPPPTEQARRAIAGVKIKGKAKKEIIKMPARVAREALERAGLVPAAYAPSLQIAASADVAHDFGAAAFHRIASLRPSLDRFVADERAPAHVDGHTRAMIERRVALGATASRTIGAPDSGFIGYDLGTSTTKVVVRWPYGPGRAAQAIAVPPGWRSGGVAHLWPTILYFDRDHKRFSLLPGEGSIALSGFKAGLIEGNGHRMLKGVEILDATIAFVAMHLAYVLGTIAGTCPDRRVGAVNLGVPVAALAEAAVKRSFETVLRTALLLVDAAPGLTLEDVKAARELSGEMAGGPIEPNLYTELSGAIAGYCNAPRRARGAHMIVDRGSATLDIASFRLGDGHWPIGIHAAGVEPLGADACAVYQSAGASADDCAAAAYHHEHRIYADTLASARLSFQQDDDRRYPYQVILIGGGMAGPVHKPLFERMARAFRRPFHSPRLDPALLCEDGTHPGRLVLADGLARSPVDLREVAMPRDRRQAPDRFGADQNSKDVC